MQRRQEKNNMAKTYELEVQAQPSIYEPQERTMRMYFAEPEDGVNQDTGILLFFAGYGATAQSKIFQKMRKVFADAYNLLTIQCDYFGYEYMQNDIKSEVSLNAMKKVLSAAELELLQRDYEKYAHILKGKIFEQKLDLGETASSFNDMSFMQTIDNLRAVKILLDIVKDNQYEINRNRIYAYGFSHGAYLAYLCNAFWPGLFTAFVDNSSYLTPYYLKQPRELIVVEDGIQVKQLFCYKASEYVEDEELLYLPKLYKQFDNQADIICYAGEADYMTSLEDKKSFLNQVEHAKVETITESRVDMVRFKSTNHGLGADFIELFHFAYKTYLEPKEEERKKKRKKEDHEIAYENIAYDTKKFHYEVRWEDGMPILYRIKQK